MGDVAAIILGARKSAGLTQDQLARLVGTSQPALARYEKGSALPTLPTLERILLGCGKSLELRAASARGAAPPVTSVLGQLGPLVQSLRRNRGRLLDAAWGHGVRAVRVFGSLARGEEVAASDVDLLVDLAPDRTLLDLVAFRREAQEILGLPVDVATVDMLKKRVRAEILAEALPL